MGFSYTFPFYFYTEFPIGIIDLTETEELTVESLDFTEESTIGVLDLYEPEEVVVEVLEI